MEAELVPAGWIGYVVVKFQLPVLWMAWVCLPSEH